MTPVMVFSNSVLLPFTLRSRIPVSEPFVPFEVDVAFSDKGYLDELVLASICIKRTSFTQMSLQTASLY